MPTRRKKPGPLTKLYRVVRNRVHRLVFGLVRARSRWRARAIVVKPHPPAIAVHSFDGYRRFWEPVALFATEHLPATGDFFFGSENIPYDTGPFNAITTGQGSFVSRLLELSRQLEERGYKYVLYLQEDMWITDDVSVETLDSCVTVMEAYQLDILKLGLESFWSTDIDLIRRTCGPLGEDGFASNLLWFGPNQYAMGHHVSMFRTRFLIETLEFSKLVGVTTPIDHELTTTRVLNRKTKSHTADDGVFRIAVWKNAPVIDYVHASSLGRLTAPAREMLERRNALHLYREDLPGEVFPDRRFDVER